MRKEEEAIRQAAERLGEAGGKLTGLVRLHDIYQSVLP